MQEGCFDVKNQGSLIFIYLLVNQTSFPFCFHQVLWEVGCVNSCGDDCASLCICRQIEWREKYMFYRNKLKVRENNLLWLKDECTAPLSHVDIWQHFISDWLSALTIGDSSRWWHICTLHFKLHLQVSKDSLGCQIFHQ